MPTDEDQQQLTLVGEGFMRVPQAAEFLGVSRSTVYELMDKGQLPYAKFGRSRRIPKRALMEFAAQSVVRR
jgi:excisionase family DNA binding protein